MIKIINFYHNFEDKLYLKYKYNLLNKIIIEKYKNEIDENKKIKITNGMNLIVKNI